MRKLAILGASGHGKVVADTAELCGWGTIQFFDDAWPVVSKNGRWPVVGDSAALLSQMGAFDAVIVAIGNNAIRYTKMIELECAGASFATLVHPAATISQYSSIGHGCVVFAGAVVNAGASLGWGVIVNSAASVDHDCVVGVAAHISPGARLAGGVSIGDRAWIGMGVSVKQMLCIGTNAVVGMGAVVVSDVADNQTVVGVPARPIDLKK